MTSEARIARSGVSGAREPQGRWDATLPPADRPSHPELSNSRPKGSKTLVTIKSYCPQSSSSRAEKAVTYYLILAAGESDGGRLFPNLVWTQVAISVLQDTYTIFPLGTIPHSAKVHRLGATHQTHGRFRRAWLCNTMRYRNYLRPFPVLTLTSSGK